MSITVNNETLTAVLTEANGKNELTAILNEIIDEELNKDEMNTELVDECVQAIMELESGSVNSLASYQELMRYCQTNAFKKRIRLRRAALIAAAAAVITGSAFATSPALAEQAKSFVSSIMISLGIAADSTDTGKSEIVSIYAKPNEDTSFTVKSEDEINPENVKIFAVDKYDTEKEIPLSKCKIKTEHLDGSHIVITYSYEGCACSLTYTLEVA